MKGSKTHEENQMDIKPVRRYRTAAYATNAILEQHPELLRLVPKRWQSKPVVITALTSLCVLMYGCRAEASTVPLVPYSHIAPIFEHGDGRGSFGCISVNPPIFLSEDEARQVIIDEAKKAKIEFVKDALTIEHVLLPDPTPHFFRKDAEKETKLKEQSVEIDGTDQKRRISFEFVSDNDVKLWTEKPMVWSSVRTVDTAESAKVLREGLEKVKPEGTCAIFYDPAIGPCDVMKRRRDKFDEANQVKDTKQRWEQTQIAAKDIAKEDLRAQVQDFIKWLKSQGVI